MSKRQRHIRVRYGERVVLHWPDQEPQPPPPAASSPADDDGDIEQLPCWLLLSLVFPISFLGWLAVTFWPIMCLIAVAGVILLLYKAGVFSALARFWNSLRKSAKSWRSNRGTG